MYLNNMLAKYKEKLKNKGEIYLRIKARPAMGKSEITGIITDENGETIKINIGAPPVKGKANQELIKFLAKVFATRKGNVKIISGAKDRIKLIKIIR